MTSFQGRGTRIEMYESETRAAGRRSWRSHYQVRLGQNRWYCDQWDSAISFMPIYGNVCEWAWWGGRVQLFVLSGEVITLSRINSFVFLKNTKFDRQIVLTKRHSMLIYQFEVHLKKYTLKKIWILYQLYPRILK